MALRLWERSATPADSAAPGGMALRRSSGGGGAWLGTRAPLSFPSGEASSRMAFISPPMSRMNPLI